MNRKKSKVVIWCVFLIIMLFEIGISEYYENQRGLLLRQLVDEISQKLEPLGIEVTSGYFHRSVLKTKAVSVKPIEKEVIIKCLGNDFTLATDTPDSPGWLDYTYNKPPKFTREIRATVRDSKQVDGLFEIEIFYYAHATGDESKAITTPMYALLFIMAVFLYIKYGDKK